MAYYKKLVGAQCYLSPVSLEDAANWSQWLEIGMDEAEKKIREIHDTMGKCFTIVDLASDEALGIASVVEINQLYRNCSFELIVPNDNSWAGDLVREALLLLLDFTFNCLDMHSVSLWLPENEASRIECCRKAGFRISARRRQSRIISASAVDEIYLDILANEYESVYINKILDEMDSYSLGTSAG